MSRFVKLHAKAGGHGLPTWVNVERIERFGGLNPQADGSSSGGFVSFSEADENGFLHVLETPEQILALIAQDPRP